MTIILGEKIRELRKMRGMSQEQLAEQMDVSRQSVSKWENGAAEPSHEKMAKLAEVFGVSVGDMRNAKLSVEDVCGTRGGTAPKIDVSIKMSKQLKVAVLASLVIFLGLFAFGVYADITKAHSRQTILYVMIGAMVFMLFAAVTIFVHVLRFVYKDCKARGIRPTFWVIISSTFLGLAYYMMKRDGLFRR